MQTDRVWAALSNPTFRALWLGSVALNLAIWMQSAVAAWMMVSLDASPVMVALIQTASALPSFIFALPSGVMADLVERRRYLLSVVCFMSCVAVALCAFALANNLSAWLLLFFTFCLGLGFALQGPAWFTAQTDAVSHPLMPSAIALTAVSYNSARAVGPALAGVAVSSLGAVGVFIGCVILLVIALFSLLRWESRAKASKLPPEDLVSGLRSAFRYVRHSDVMKAQILRNVLFVGVASALFALLPLIAKEQLNSGAGGYGLLLGSIGAGCVAGALMLARLRQFMDINRMMGISAIVYGCAMIGVVHIVNMFMLCMVLFLSGAVWICIVNTNMLAQQSAVPAWVRARTLAVYMVVFQGSTAAGSALWGTVAAKAGTSNALICAGLLMFGVLLVMNRFPARLGKEDEATASGSSLHSAFSPASVPPDAAVAVQIVYHVKPENRVEFLHQLHAIGKVRRRDGASFWRVYRDLEKECCYVERFIVDSWSQYLRQRSRATITDQEAEKRLWAIHAGQLPPVISHYVSEPCP